MRMLVLIPTVAAVALWMSPASGQNKENASGKEETQESAVKVKELQSERIATLKAMADLNTRLFQSGQASLEAALEARVLVVEAELEAAETEADRIPLYQNLVKVLKQYEDAANRSVLADRATEAAVLKVKARRLLAEIHLEQAKAKIHDRPRPKIVVDSLKKQDAVITQRYTGQIQSWRRISVRSLESGHLSEVLVKEGQLVKKGEVMFRILPAPYRAKLEAELAKVKTAQLDLENGLKLFQAKEIAQNEVSRLEARLAQAQAKAKLADAEPRFTEIKAPFDGILGRLQQQEGSLITEGNILTTLFDNSSMWVYFNVPQARYLEYLASGKKIAEWEIELELARGQIFAHAGRIGAIEAEFDSTTGSIPFRADFPNPDGVLRHGMTGDVLLRRPLNNVLVIPQQAIIEVLDKRYVYVVDKDNVAHRREVAVQHALAGTFVTIKGVDAGDRIILEGARHVHDGETVEYGH